MLEYTHKNKTAKYTKEASNILFVNTLGKKRKKNRENIKLRKKKPSNTVLNLLQHTPHYAHYLNNTETCMLPVRSITLKIPEIEAVIRNDMEQNII